MYLKRFVLLLGTGLLILGGCNNSTSGGSAANGTSSTGNEASSQTQGNTVLDAIKNSPEVNIPASIFPNLGNPDAKVRIDFFFDPWCPPCKAFDKEIRTFMKDARYKDNVVVYFHLFPLLDHFPNDKEASLLYLEMAKHNLFLEFRDAVVNGDISSYPDMLALAQKMAKKTFTIKELEASDGQLLQKQLDEANALKLSYTPMIFVNQKQLTTTPSMEELSAGVDQLLAQQNPAQ